MVAKFAQISFQIVFPFRILEQQDLVLSDQYHLVPIYLLRIFLVVQELWGPLVALDVFVISGRILGIHSFPISILENCPDINGNNSTITSKLLSSVSYNLNVFNEDPYLATRVVSVLIQAAALNEPFGNTGTITQIDFANKQFQTTLDTLYGEKFAANILLPTNLMRNYAGLSGVVQIVIYIEEGISIQVLPNVSQVNLKNTQNVSLNQTENQIGAISSQYFSTNIWERITQPGTYPLKAGRYDIISKSGGGGGGAGGGYDFRGAILNSGGGGGEGSIVTSGTGFINSGFIQVVSIGSGGLGGGSFSTPLELIPLNGQDGGDTVYQILDDSQNIIFSITSKGGKGGSAASFNSGGNGGDGGKSQLGDLIGAGGGGGGISTGTVGKGGNGDPSGQDGQSVNGGQGGGHNNIAGGNGGTASGPSSGSWRRSRISFRF
jgi:uncharacterized protein YbcV (DUF1398 family)